MLQFLDGVPSRKCYGSLMGWAGRANVERPFAIEHLEYIVNFSTKSRVVKQQTSHIVPFASKYVYST